MLLQSSVCGKCDSILGSSLRIAVGCLLLLVLGTLGAAEPLLGVNSALVGSQMTGRIKSHLAFMSCLLFHMGTWKRLLI